MSKTLDSFKVRNVESLKREQPINNNDKQRRMGRLHPPLLNIDLNNVVPDELHLLLRVMDVLIRNLINAAMTNDTQHEPRNKDPLKGTMVKKLLNAINRIVTFHIRIKETNKGFDFSSLTGVDKYKLLKRLPENLLECQPKDFSNEVKLLWEVNCC